MAVTPRNAVAIAAAAAAVIAAAAFMFLGPRAPGPGSEDVLVRGAQLYNETCAECHGKNLEGQPNWRSRNADGTLPAPPHDASGHTWHHPDKVLFDYTRLGGAALAPPGFKSAMPGFGGTLTDAEIRAVLEYIKSRWPDREREHQRRITAEQGG